MDAFLLTFCQDYSNNSNENYFCQAVTFSYNEFQAFPTRKGFSFYVKKNWDSQDAIPCFFWIYEVWR